MRKKLSHPPPPTTYTHICAHAQTIKNKENKLNRQAIAIVIACIPVLCSLNNKVNSNTQNGHMCVNTNNTGRSIIEGG